MENLRLTHEPGALFQGPQAPMERAQQSTVVVETVPVPTRQRWPSTQGSQAQPGTQHSHHEQRDKSTRGCGQIVKTDG